MSDALPNRPESLLPTVAIVGRTNVGKSSLFNRIIGKQKSIVQPEHGTTVDLLTQTIKWKSAEFQLIDSGGYSFSKAVEYRSDINSRVESILKNSTIVLFVCDASAGIHPQDELLSDLVRPRKKSVIHVINKADDSGGESEADRFYQFGYDNLVKVSALHGHGVYELLDMIAQKIPERQSAGIDNHDFSLTIAGEPNCGKSTYFNALLAEDRAVVSEIPGTTRDTLSEVLNYRGKNILLQDTAGLRASKRKLATRERLSMAKTREAIRTTEVVLLFFDAYKGFSTGSKQIADSILEFRKACVIVANKWDTVKGMPQEDYRKLFQKRVRFLNNFPLIFVSAATKRNILEPLDAAIEVYDSYAMRRKTNDLNRFLEEFKRREASKLKENVRLKFLTQVKTAPPTFLLIGRRVGKLKPESVQFLENSLIDYLSLTGTPINLLLREET